MDAKKTDLQDISQEDMNACRALMLNDILQDLLLLDVKSSGVVGDVVSKCLTYALTHSNKVGDKEIKEEMRLVSMYTLGLRNKKLIVLETVYKPLELLLLHPSTPRGKLIKEHREVHPLKCFCDVNNDKKQKLCFGYSYTSGNELQHALFNASFTLAEARQAFCTVLKMQCDAFKAIRADTQLLGISKNLFPSKNYHRNFRNLKQLLEYKDE
jgi:hypothetical protein